MLRFMVFVASSNSAGSAGIPARPGSRASWPAHQKIRFLTGALIIVSAIDFVAGAVSPRHIYRCISRAMRLGQNDDQGRYPNEKGQNPTSLRKYTQHVQKNLAAEKRRSRPKPFLSKHLRPKGGSPSLCIRKIDAGMDALLESQNEKRPGLQSCPGPKEVGEKNS